MRKLSAIPAVAILLSGCGGGGGGTSAALPAPVNGSPRLPSASDSITIKVPSSVSPSGRRGAYVPANAGSVRISVTAVNGVPPSPAIPDVIAALSPTAQGCSNATGSLVCTVTALLPIATVTLAVSIYASSDGSGTPLATNTVTTAVGSGTTPSISLTLGGVPSTMSLGAPIVTSADGTTKTIALPVTVFDSSGATIIAPGTYSSPVNLAISNDPNSALSLSSSQVTGPAASGPTTVNLIYNSAKALTSATITATSTGATSVSTQVNPLVYSPTSLAAMVINGLPASVIVSEAGYSGAFTIAGAGSIATTSCVPANCTPTSAGGQVTINVQPGNIVGLATMAVTDSHSVVASVPLGVASTGGSIPIPGLPTFFADPMSAGKTHPQNPVTGSDGRVWFSEQAGTQYFAGAMTPAGVVSDYGPFTGGAAPAINSAALGPDGNVYYVDIANTQVDVVTPSGAVSVNNAAGLSVADVIAEGPDNLMWIFGTATGSPKIIKMTTNGSTQAMTLSGAPLGNVTSMIAAPDGNMWFAQLSPSAIGKITPGGVVSMATGLTGNPNAGLALGSDGCIWGTETIGGNSAVTMIFVGTTTVAEITSGISPGAAIGGIAPGGDGNLWFAEQGVNSVGRITTGGVVTEYYAGAGHTPTAMVLAPNGEMWFTEYTKNTLGWLTY
jgi:virginiamycin B lyase